MDKSKKVIIPVTIVWTAFVYNFIFAFNEVNERFKYKCTYESDSQCSTRRIADSIYAFFLIIVLLIELIAVIFVSLSCCNNSYCCYLTGMVFLFNFSILISIVYCIFNENKYTIILITRILMQWIQIIALFIYSLKVNISSDRNSYINNNLVNDFPTPEQSLQQEHEQDKEKIETPV